MHRCDPDDHEPCTAWCQGDTHVDVVYGDFALLVARGQQLLDSFQQWHARRHVQAYKTPVCTIVAMKPAPEAPAVQERYTVPILWYEPSAYLVTYQVSTALPKETLDA